MPPARMLHLVSPSGSLLMSLYVDIFKRLAGARSRSQVQAPEPLTSCRGVSIVWAKRGMRPAWIFVHAEAQKRRGS